MRSENALLWEELGIVFSFSKQDVSSQAATYSWDAAGG
jgi:hypothetical protein